MTKQTQTWQIVIYDNDYVDNFYCATRGAAEAMATKYHNAGFSALMRRCRPEQGPMVGTPTLQEILKILAKTQDNHLLLSMFLKLTADRADKAAKHVQKPKKGKMPIVTIAVDSSALRECADELLALRQCCLMLVEKINLDPQSTTVGSA